MKKFFVSEEKEFYRKLKRKMQIYSFSGFVFIGIHFAMLKMHFDDPLDAVAVHVGGGSVGIFFVHFFSSGEGIFWKVTEVTHTKGQFHQHCSTDMLVKRSK